MGASRTGTTRRRLLTARGSATRRRILNSGEDAFGSIGYHAASIGEITRGAGVALGTFYLYFESKPALLRELLIERGREMRIALTAATAQAERRVDKERAGFQAFMLWISEHRALYRIVRQAEYIDREVFEGWYRGLAGAYASALATAAADGEIAPIPDSETLAYALMGVGDFVGMRWLVWEGQRCLTAEAERTLLDFVVRGLGVGTPNG